MPTRGDTQINTFVKGLVTDASPLSYPPNTCLDLINFRLNKDGTNFRRLGLDFEDNYLLTATGYSTDVLATARKAFYHWPLPNGNALVDIGVVQIGAKFWFLNLYAESPSTAILNGGNAVTAAVDPSSRFSFAVINNYLLVVSNNLPDPYLVSYDYALDSITFETSPILVRDLWGVDDELDVGARPTTLTPKHYYNLLNQGWSNGIVSTCTPAGISAIDCTFITLGVYPANSDVWTIGRVGDLTSADVHKYDPNIAKRNIFNIGQVPQGHYILPLKNRGADRQLQTGLTVPMDREIGTISCVAAYAGRAFYAGILSEVQDGDSRSPLLTGAVLFSQTFEQKIQLVKCYQEADPTSPDISDVLDTDGGIIFIPECSAINHLRAIKESLFVFAVNGIWEIRGGENGFTATSFQVNKVSNVGVYSPDSIVEINGQILFWGVNGIYAITKNQFGIYETNSITKNVIQKYYDSLPDWARTQAKGYYDLNSNTVRWLFYSDDAKVAGQAIDTQPPAPVVPTVLAGAVNTTITTNVNITKVCRISDTSYIIVYLMSTSPFHLKGVVCSVNPTTAVVTMGAEITINNTDSSDSFDVIPLSSTKILVAYGATPFADTFTRVLTISGLTFTAGAANTHAGITSRVLANYTSTSALLINDAGATVAARMLTIAGDVVTASASVNVSTFTGAGDVQRIDNTRALFVGESATRGAVVITAGATPSVGTPLDISAWVVDSLGGITIGVGTNNTIANLAARGSSAELKCTQLAISGATLTRDVASEYTSATMSVFESQNHWNTVLDSNIAVNIAANNETGTRYPYLETLNIATASSTVRSSRTLLASKMIARMHCTKISENLVVWSAANGTASGPLLTQAVRIT